MFYFLLCFLFCLFTYKMSKNKFKTLKLKKIVPTCNKILFYFVNFALNVFGCLLYVIHCMCPQNAWLRYLFLYFLKVYKARCKTKNICEKKVKMSNLLAKELNFTFTPKQRLKNSKKKGNKLKMAAKLLAIVNLTLCTFFETL